MDGLLDDTISEGSDGPGSEVSKHLSLIARGVTDTQDVLPSSTDRPSSVAMPDAVECFESFSVGVGERVQVALSGLDLAVPESVHHRLQIRTTGE